MNDSNTKWPAVTPDKLWAEPDNNGAVIAEAICNAKYSVDIPMWEIGGPQMMANLKTAKANGVAIRIMFNGQFFAGGDPANPRYNQVYQVIRELKGAAGNGSLQFHWASNNFSITHQKTIIIDAFKNGEPNTEGAKALVLTLNAVPYAWMVSNSGDSKGKVSPLPWAFWGEEHPDAGFKLRDFGAQISDPELVAKIAAVFESDFGCAPANVTNDLKDSTDGLVWSNGTTGLLDYYPNGGVYPSFEYANLKCATVEGNARQVHYDLIDQAKKTLIIYNEEFDDDGILNKLLAALKRGVEIRFILTGNVWIDNNDNNSWQYESAGTYSTFTQAGGQLRLFPATNDFMYIHAKVLVADGGTPDALAFMGSENFSGNSLDFNRELGIQLQGQKDTDLFVDTFNKDWATPGLVDWPKEGAIPCPEPWGADLPVFNPTPFNTVPMREGEILVPEETLVTTSAWKNDAPTGEWNSSDNWVVGEVPQNTAIFGKSTQNDISFLASDNANVEKIEFETDAPAYTFHFGASSAPLLTLTGAGVANNSRNHQHFVVACSTSGYKQSQLNFTNKASGGGRDVYYTAGPATESDYGGGVIRFCDESSAGTATYTAWTGAGIPPAQGSTVGGEISFSDYSSAAGATFIIYGSLGTDGDTFGNVVFHNDSTAANAIFTNQGGTVPGGDGGNTQFYDSSTASNGRFYNYGGTNYGEVNGKHQGANGGDVAFDTIATGGTGYYFNYAATVDNANGGVTSFNNNWPNVPPQDVKPGQPTGTSAESGHYFNFGAQKSAQCGGGHVSFSSVYGSPTAENATITNYGSEVEDSKRSSAGHTYISSTYKSDYEYFPTAANAVINNFPGKASGAPGGYTEFAVFDVPEGKPCRTDNIPRAGNCTIYNHGATIKGAYGGNTTFANTTRADSALLVAYGGTNEGEGGEITFKDASRGDSATIKLYGNARLELSGHDGELTIGSLETTEGAVVMQLGDNVTSLNVSDKLTLNSEYLWFDFYGNVVAGTAYTVLTAQNLGDYKEWQFKSGDVDNLTPSFAIQGEQLQVTFSSE